MCFFGFVMLLDWLDKLKGSTTRWRISSLPAANPQRERRRHTTKEGLDAFLNALWIVRDNCISPSHSLCRWQGKDGTSLCETAPGQDAYRLANPRSEHHCFSHEELRLGLQFSKERVEPAAASIELSKTKTSLSWTDAQTIHSAPFSRGHRFYSLLSAARKADDPGLRIALMMSCLELLFVSADAEISYQLSERVAFFLASGFKERTEIFRRAKVAYTVRSQVLHGGAVTKKHATRLMEIAQEVDDLVRRVVTRIYVDRDGPDLLSFSGEGEEVEDYFRRLIFSPETFAALPAELELEQK